jgi:Kelch motif
MGDMCRLAVISLTLWGCSQMVPMQPPQCTADTCARALDFADGPPLATGMDHHGTVIATTEQGAFLYVLGGNDYSRQFRTVWASAIAEDGSLAPWVPVRPLPEARAGHGVAVVNGRIFVAGGQAHGTFFDTVYSAAVLPDGTLSEWQPEPSLPAPRFHAYVATTPEWFYVTGGVDANFDATDTVFRAAIGPDGRLTAFTDSGHLPVPRSHHAAVAHHGRLYLAGGLTGNPTGTSEDFSDVIAAAILLDGSLAPFTTVTTLAAPSATLSQFELDGAWYLAGGLDDHGHYLGDITKILFAGGAPEALTPGLPFGRSHVHQTPIYKDHFYSVGGSVHYQTVTNAVEIGNFAWGQALPQNPL